MATTAALRSTTIGRRSLCSVALSRRTVDAAYEHSLSSSSPHAFASSALTSSAFASGAFASGAHSAHASASLSGEITETLRTLAYADVRFVFESTTEQRDAFRLYPFGDAPPYDALFITDGDLTDDELRAVRALASFAHVTERSRLVSSAPAISSSSSSSSSTSTAMSFAPNVSSTSVRFELSDELNRRAAAYIDTYALVERTTANVLRHCDSEWFALYSTLFESAVASFGAPYGDRALRLINAIRSFCR